VKTAASTTSCHLQTEGRSNRHEPSFGRNHKQDGTPGPNFARAQQFAGVDQGSTDPFLLNPAKLEFPDNQLPAPLVGGPKTPYVPTLAEAQLDENGLAPAYYQYLTTGGTGQTSATPDMRIKDVNSLRAGPFQLTNPEHDAVRRLCSKPGASLLPDVATTGLQH